MIHRSSCLLRAFLTIVGLSFGLQTTVCYALSFTVTVDTTSLATQPTPPGPFSLEFQLNDGGDNTVNNTVTLSNFNFGIGGSASGLATLTGGASGDLSTSVILTDTAFFNQFIQGFTPSATSPLTFLLDITGNVEPLTPDAFSFAIFDSSGIGLPTLFFDVFLQIDITGPLTINSYAIDPTLAPPGINIPASLVTPDGAVVPEPGTLMLLASGLVLLALRQKMRTKA